MSSQNQFYRSLSLALEDSSSVSRSLESSTHSVLKEKEIAVGSKQLQSTFPALVQISGDVKQSPVSSHCIPKDLAFPVEYLKNSLLLQSPSKLDEAMKILFETFGGALKLGKGSLKSTLDQGTIMKVSSYRDIKTNSVYLEFNCIDGSPFIFQKAFVRSKILLINCMDVADAQGYRISLETELKLIEQKTNVWFGLNHL